MVELLKFPSNMVNQTLSEIFSLVESPLETVHSDGTVFIEDATYSVARVTVYTLSKTLLNTVS